ncbi:MAG: hypothetical protein O9266_05205 [Porphyrobacter sp.]|nr:hypothetical protein [Porphyrobacter sp.]
MMRADRFAVTIIRLCCGLVVALPATLAAQEIDPDPRFWLEAGVYLPEAETEIGLFEPDRSRGTLISLEDQLGFETDASSIDVTLGAKIDDRFFTEASVFALRRSTEVTLDDAIEVEDVVYPVGAQVKSDFETDVFRLSFGYRFVKKDNWELAAMVGAHLTDFAFRVVGEASVGTEQRTEVESGRTVLAPLPVVGLQAKYRPAKWLELRARGDVFDIEVGAYDGRLVNLEASATAAITGNLAAGVAFRTTDYRVRVNANRYAANLDYSFDGLRLFLRLSL